MKKNIFSLAVTAALIIFSMVMVSCEKADNGTGVEALILSSEELNMVKGDTEQLTYKILPEELTDVQVQWSVDNANASVDEKGLVTALEVGSSVVTCSTEGFSATCQVNIYADEILPESVQIVPEAIQVGVNKYAYLDYGILPKNATERTVTWKSEDESIVTVDQTGRIEGISEGKTHVVVTTTNGKVGKCEVTVESKKVESLTLSYTGWEFDLNGMCMGYNHVSQLLPEDVSDKTLIWTSQDPNVCTVEWFPEENKALITAVGEGYTEIWTTTPTNPEIKEVTHINVAKTDLLPWRFAHNWHLVECYFTPDGGEALLPTEYKNYLIDEGISSTEAGERVDMLERYLSYKVNEDKTFLILTVTAKDLDAVYEANGTSFRQVRIGTDVDNYEAEFDLSAAPQTIIDKFAVQPFKLDDENNTWYNELYFEDYGVTVKYGWKREGQGESIL